MARFSGHGRLGYVVAGRRTRQFGVMRFRACSERLFLARPLGVHLAKRDRYICDQHQQSLDHRNHGDTTLSNAQPPQREQANASRAGHYPQLEHSASGFDLEHSVALRIGLGAVAAVRLLAAFVSKSRRPSRPPKKLE